MQLAHYITLILSLVSSDRERWLSEVELIDWQRLQKLRSYGGLLNSGGAAAP